MFTLQSRHKKLSITVNSNGSELTRTSHLLSSTIVSGGWEWGVVWPRGFSEPSPGQSGLNIYFGANQTVTQCNLHMIGIYRCARVPNVLGSVYMEVGGPR